MYYFSLITAQLWKGYARWRLLCVAQSGELEEASMFCYYLHVHVLSYKDHTTGMNTTLPVDRDIHRINIPQSQLARVRDRKVLPSLHPTRAAQTNSNSIASLCSFATN